MTAPSFSCRPLAGLSFYGATLGSLLAVALAGCGDKDEPDAAAGAAGASASAGTTGGASVGSGGSQPGTGGTQPGTGGSQPGTGGSPAGTGGGPAGTSGAGARGGTGGSGGTSSAAQGGSQSGTGGSTSQGGKGGHVGVPAPSDDGSSPYERECHGDTAMCEDVEALRCLGIRDDATVYGYSCSNGCETDADCSTAPASGEAKAGCVDFVTQKHCLLVCLSGGTMHSCPEGMGCYVYPQSPTGYCLWQ